MIIIHKDSVEVLCELQCTHTDTVRQQTTVSDNLEESGYVNINCASYIPSITADYNSLYNGSTLVSCNCNPLETIISHNIRFIGGYYENI